MSRWAGPAAVAGGQLGVGLVVLAVGVWYDWIERPPGLLTIAALVFLGGPGFALALREAQRPRAFLRGGERAELLERRELLELEDPRRRE